MKMRPLMLSLALLPAFALTAGCETTAETKPAPETAPKAAMDPQAAAFEQALAAAKAANKAAAELHNEWRDTAKIISAAEQAAAKGDYATAIKLANKAEEQGKLAVQQARDNANAGNPSYLY